jgi:uncharacterized protein (TIGR03437 family)
VRNTACLSVLIACFSPTIVGQTLVGSQVTLTIDDPALGTVATEPATQTVPASFPSGTLIATNGLPIIGVNINVAATSIDLSYTENSTAFTATFNGYVFIFAGAPTITGVSLDPTSTFSSSQVGLSFLPNQVAVNVEGLSLSTSSRIVVDLQFGMVSPAPSINQNGVVNGASFQPGISPGSWATIDGNNLSSLSGTWDNFIVDGQLPTTVDGVSVTIGGEPAYVYYISSAQINVLVPTDVGTGSQPVLVKNSIGTSASVTVTVSPFGPAFFPWPNNQVVATHQNFSLAAANGTFSGATTTPATAGETIILWGTGFGPTTPAAPAGIATPNGVAYSTSTLPTITIDDIPANVYGAALAPGFAGLFQVAIQVPTSLNSGDWPVVATIGGVSSPSGMVLTVQ